MPELSIAFEQVEVAQFAAAPALIFRLRVTNSDPAEVIHTVVLRCQIQIEVARRKYSAEDQKNLEDLFGAPARWGQTLRNLLWTNTSCVVPQFTGSTLVDVQVPCTFDFTVATTKYFNGLADGDIPVSMMFSGSVFYQGPDDSMLVAPISWATETRFRVPLDIWKRMMDVYYPNCAWLTLRRDVFEQLHRFKVERGIPTWEQTLEALLTSAPVLSPLPEETVRV